MVVCQQLQFSRMRYHHVNVADCVPWLLFIKLNSAIHASAISY